MLTFDEFVQQIVLHYQLPSELINVHRDWSGATNVPGWHFTIPRHLGYACLVTLPDGGWEYLLTDALDKAITDFFNNDPASDD